jgi:hypothetical protein
MTDEELEQLIGRYRPADPLPDLRVRVVAAAARAPRVRLGALDWTFAAAAAALILAAVATRTPEVATASAADVARQRAVRDTAELLGGGAEAFRLAELVVPPVPEPMPVETLEGQW